MRHLPVVLELGPFAVFYAVMFLVPLALLVAFSFFKAELYTATPAFQLDAYVTALSDPLFYRVLLNTIEVGLITSVVCVALAYPFVYAITFVFPRWRNAVQFMVLVTLFAGYLARIYAWRTLLGSEGLVNSTLISAGAIQEPLRFLLYSPFAIVITMLSIYLPFAIIPISSAMQNLGRDTVEAARSLGAGPFTSFRTITLPLTYPGFRSAFLFCFLLAAGDYVTPTLVGGPQGLMLGNVIKNQFYGANNWPLGAALAVLLVVAVSVVYLVVDRLVRLSWR
jgi:spermidine/putrescine transport system permease protein